MDVLNLYDLHKYITKCQPHIFNLLKSSRHFRDLTISANVMIKNEERCITRCLNSLIPYVDEIILVDTGSTDNSIKFINDLNCHKIKLFNYKWCDSFSTIRNYMLTKSTCDVIFVIDADEYLDENVNIFEFKNLVSYLISTFNDKVVISPTLIDSDNTKCDSLVRIFKNSGSFYYYGCVHEELRHSYGSLPDLISINIILNHDGYESDQVIKKNKINRNINLLKKTLEMESTNYRWLFFLMRDMYIFERFDQELLAIANECLEKIQLEDVSVINYKRQSYIYIGLIFYRFGKVKELNNIVNMINTIYPDNIDCFYLELLSAKTNLTSFVQNLENKFTALKSLSEFETILNIKRTYIITELFWIYFCAMEYEKCFLLLTNLNNDEKDKVLKDVKIKLSIIERGVLKTENPDCYFSELINSNCYHNVFVK